MYRLKFIRAGNLLLGSLLPGPVSRVARRMLMTPRQRPLKNWERDFLAGGEHFFLRSGLSAYRWGQGPKILCMHGWEGRPSQFQHMIPALVAFT